MYWFYNNLSNLSGFRNLYYETPVPVLCKNTIIFVLRYESAHICKMPVTQASANELDISIFIDV